MLTPAAFGTPFASESLWEASRLICEVMSPLSSVESRREEDALESGCFPTPEALILYGLF